MLICVTRKSSLIAFNQKSIMSSRKSKVSIIFFVFLSMIVHNVWGRKCVCTSKACKEAGVDVCRTRFSCYTEVIFDIDGTSRDNSSTRGCTEGATPLLCESNAWTRTSKRGSTVINAGGTTNELEVDPTGSRHQIMLWPRLKCCDSHDYCNSIIVVDDASKNDRRIEKSRRKSSKNSFEDENSRTRFVASSSNSSEDRNETIESPAASETSIDDHERDSERTILTDMEDRERSYDPLRHRIRPLHVAVVVLAIAALTSVLGACYVITRFLRSPFDVGSP